MDSILFTATVLNAHRADDLAREVELRRVRRERGEAVPVRRRSLADRLRTVTHRPARAGGAAAIASSH